MINGCCRNADTSLQRFCVQQQIVPVIPSSVISLQPLMPPKQTEVFVVAAREITIVPFDVNGYFDF